MPIEHVIIPVDFSSASIAAAVHGKMLAERAGADVELVSVTSPLYANTTTTALRSVAAEQGDDVAFRVITTDSDDIEGRLVEEVFARPNTLWCVGSHGRTAIGEMLFGSVSANLVRDAEVPIVVMGPFATTRNHADVLAVALDGSDLGEQIVPSAVEMARTLGLRLRLLQVGRNHLPADTNETVYLHRVAERLDPDGAIDFDVLHGSADDALVDYLERTGDVAMLAMATRGIPAGARMSVPSVTMRVLRRACVPVLVLHPEQTKAAPNAAPASATDLPTLDLRNRIVVGVDTVNASAPAIMWAADEAARHGAILQVVHTWQIPVGPGSVYGYPIWPDIDACRQAALEEAEAAVEAVAAKHPEVIVETIVAEGGAVSALSRQSVGADMVVLGRHHHNRLSTLMLGSVAGAAVQRVECPLVVVPCDDAEVSMAAAEKAASAA